MAAAADQDTSLLGHGHSGMPMIVGFFWLYNRSLLTLLHSSGHGHSHGHSHGGEPCSGHGGFQVILNNKPQRQGLNQTALFLNPKPSSQKPKPNRGERSRAWGFSTTPNPYRYYFFNHTQNPPTFSTTPKTLKTKL